VTLQSAEPSTRFRSVARAKTDGEGRYRLSNVPPGRYQIMPFAPVYIVQGMNDFPPGKPLNLAAGEEVSDIDFRLERGGVITGRVTDADGNPVIAEMVNVSSIDKDRPFLRRGPFDPRDISTDDRGVYRIYGLPAGRYRVSVGQPEERGTVSYGRRKLYQRTFYPDATEEAQARIVEVTAGGEATDVDITLGRALKTYRASGLFVSAETGEPVPNISFGIGVIDSRGRRVGSFGGAQTNARGEFQTEGLTPGRYTVSANSQENSDSYSEAAPFEVTDADVKGLVVRLRRGVSVSGVVTIEGVSDRATAARLVGGVRLIGFVEARGEFMVPNYQRPVAIGADGSFRFTGLRPGKFRISYAGETKGLAVSRIEQNGANVSSGIDIVQGTQVAGVRVVLVYGIGVVRGQINFMNGTLPASARVFVSARRAGAGNEDQSWRTVLADTRGRFVIEGLAPGEYEVRARVSTDRGQMYQSNVQHISLGESGDMSVTLTLDMSTPVNR
jgi:protocatechuate 3,4-dioxygenase beta subunit